MKSRLFNPMKANVMMKEVTLGGISLAVILYAGFSYAYLGPTVGQRIGMADHLAECRAHHKDWVEEDFKTKLAEIGDPPDGTRVAIGRQLFNSPLYKFSKKMSRYGLRPGQRNPLNDVLGFDPLAVQEGAAAQMERQYKAAKEKYDTAVEAVKARAKANLSKGDDACEQAIAKAVGDSAYEWAWFAGSGGLVEMAPVKNFRHAIKVGLTEVQKG